MVCDQELLEAYTKTRDGQAFAELARRYAPMVYATCLRVTGNRADAEDAAQETLLQLARGPEAIQKNIGGWLYRTAKNKAAEQMRSAVRRREHEKAALPAPAAIDPTVREVDEVVGSLGDDLREPVILHFVRGLTQDEVAAELRLSQPTVSRRIERALELLRARLEPSRAAAMLGSVAFAGDPAIGAQISQQVTAVVTSVKTAAAAGATASGLTLTKAAITAVIAGAALLGITAAVGVGSKAPTAASTAPAPVAAAAQPGPKSAWKIEGNKVAIEGVGSAELIGIYSDETDPPTWWGPNGEQVAMPFTRSGIQQTTAWQGSARRRFVVQVSGPAVAAPYFWQFEGAQGSRWTGNPPVAQFLPRLDLKEVEAAYPLGMNVATVRYGIASAKPKTLLEADSKGHVTMDSKEVRIAGVRPDANGIVVNFDVESLADSGGVMLAYVVNNSGHWTGHYNNNRNPHGGSVSYEQSFAVPSNEVTKIVIQGQRYTHWITWENVLLDPGKGEVTVSVRTVQP